MCRPKYLDNIVFEKDITMNNGSIIHCYSFNNCFDESSLDDWALHIRRNYVSDEALNKICNHGVNRYELLLNRIPNLINENELMGKNGPRTITGEFAEILISDFREYIRDEGVFRGRWETKSTPYSPIQGCDIISFTLGSKPENDELIITESKSQLSSTNYEVLYKAAKDSNDSDSLRIGFTLAFFELYYANKNDDKQCRVVSRFIRRAEIPCIEKYEGSGITVCSALSEESVKNALKGYEGTPKTLYFIYGEGMKKLAYDLYERALKC